MNIRNILITLCLLAVFPVTVSAKVLSVLPGGSIQEKIDEAEDNDFIAIFGGTYAEDITIDGKVIRLVEVKGQDVKLSGNVTFKNITNPPPFEGFEMTIENKNLTIESITGEMVLSDLTVMSTIVVNNADSLIIKDSNLRNVDVNEQGSVSIKDCNLAYIHQSGSNLNVINCQMTGNFESSRGDYKTIIFRTTMDHGSFWGKYVWIGYSKFRYVYSNYNSTEARFVFIGNEVDRRNQEGYGVRINNDCKFLVANNYIHDIRWNRDWNEEIGIWVDSANGQGIIQNNLISMNFGGDTHRNDSNGIYINGTSKIKIRNNLFWGCMFEITAPFGVITEGNMIMNRGGHYAGLQTRFGITGVEMPVINDDPLFGDTVYQLQEGSPLINAGSVNPLYNDRDGTRNDVGPSGGVWYDPEGWTTEKPVVISFDLSSDSVLEGIDTEITISGGRAVSSSSSEE